LQPTGPEPGARPLPRAARWIVALFGVLVSIGPAAAQGGDPNQCDAEGDEPDVIVGSIHQKERWGALGGITAFSLGTTSCNVGSCWLNWIDFNNQHPVIGQNMYRLKDGRFEHVGQSWLKHGFFALSGTLCSQDCVGTNGSHLGVNCSDPYSSFLNGKQDELGPKFEVNASTGFHPHPVTDHNNTGNVIYKRLQVHNADLDPILNPAALYFVEAQYVAEDDALAGNQNNNSSYRKILVSGSAGVFDFAFDGSTKQQQSGIRAWADHDSGVEEVEIDIPGDGRLILAAKVTELGGGTWHYEYALQNLNSHRAARSFAVPIPAGATVTNIGFHDVDYHSGEPFNGMDWSNNGGSSFAVTWTTDAQATNPNANALRWGTLYNFRFDADVPPAIHDVTVGFFRPGLPESMTAQTITPSLCDADGSCDPGENCGNCATDCANGSCDAGETVCNCAVDCGPPPPAEGACSDFVDNDCDQIPDCFDPDCCATAPCSGPDGDGDGVLGCGDCIGTDGSVWATPGEVTGLLLAKGPGGSVLSWNPPASPGAVQVIYEVLRSRDPQDFVLSTTCLASLTPQLPTVSDPQLPLPGLLFTYLVRAENTCPNGTGTLGAGSDGVPRVGRTCP